jgi:membrane-associated phospholipid phosphatase
MAATLSTSEAASTGVRVTEDRSDGLGFALGWLAAYLSASAAVLARGGHWAVLAVHVTLALAAITVVFNGRSFASLRMTSVGLLAVLLIWPLLYFEIPLLVSSVGSTYHDALIQRWEETFFQSQPSHVLASRLPFQWLSELLHAGYLAYYPAIFAPTLFLLWRNKTHAATRLVIAVGVVYGLCWTIYTVFPVQGPRYLWAARPDVPAGPMRTIAEHLLAAGSSRGAAFPSSHMAVPTVQAVVAWAADRRLSLLLSVITLLVGVGAVYGGFHYAVDILAGGGLAVVVGLMVLFATVRANRGSRLECP